MEATQASLRVRRRGSWLTVYAWLVLAFLMAPSLIVVVISFSGDRYMAFPPREWTLSWYREFLGSPEWLRALWVSLRAAVLTSVIATVAGTLASFGLYRMKGRLAAAFRALLMAPAIVPVVLIAAALFMLFAEVSFGNRLAGVVLAHSALALPFVFVTVSAGLKTYDFTLDRAARSLGAGPIRCFLTITLPQIKGPVAASALFAFLTSFDEAVVALFITGGTSATLAQRMFESLRDDLDPVIAAISTLVIAVTSSIFLMAHLLSGRRS
jgi:putative spermidine/putrescine transport system permease protein